MGDAMGTRKDKESTIMPNSLLLKRRRRCTNQHRMILEMPNLQKITIGHRVDGRALCKTGRDRGRGPFLRCYGGRTSTTRKHLGSRA